MPIHDWKRVTAGIFHALHGAWITHLQEALNAGLLPEGFYAMSEQHGGQIVAAVLTFNLNDAAPGVAPAVGVLTRAAAPPCVGWKAMSSPEKAARALRKTLAIRHASNHRMVAIIEILSPANKDRAGNVADFVRKAQSAINLGCHLLLIDLFPPGRSDLDGMHAAIWDAFGDELATPPADKPLTLATYLAAPLPEAYLEFVAVGTPLPEMPLFLDADGYVNVPLEPTYMAAYRGMPAYWREVVEGRRSP